MFGIVITSGTDSMLLSRVAQRTGAARSPCGMRIQGLVSPWGLGLFNEVVICLHRGWTSILKFTMSSGFVYSLLSVSNEKKSMVESATSHLMMHWHRPSLLLRDATTSGFVYVHPPGVGTYTRGGRQAGKCTQARGGFALPGSRVCLCSRFFKGTEDFPGFGPSSLHQDHQKNHINICVVERERERERLKTPSSLQCVENVN